ncbi:MAG TPA: LamG domain-containing protein, partial [Candidatus Paceibacterota bacterium]|nr:LamG domain-containing protein [Candidatus Paceibacterota bacterium]
MAVPIRHKIVLAAIIFYAAFAWTAAAHAAIIKPSNNFGLTGYWNLDEGKGATAFDHASAPHNGTLTASPTWTTGKLGQALTFGAANNYVSTGAPWSSTNGSISVWVYPTAYADWISPAGWKTDPNTTNNGYILLDEGGSGTPGKWRAVFRPKIGGGAASEIDVLALQNIAQNTWQHLVMTWSLSGTTYTVHLYVNGVDQGSLTWTGTPGSNGVGGFNFGKSGDYADNYFKGKVDDVRIYNRVLPLSEVKALYNRTAGTRYNASSATLGNGSTLQSGLVGWWTFDGSTIGATIGDSSGQGNNGYIGGGVATSSMKVTGKLGQALTFNGNTSYVNVSDASSLDGGTGTVSFWYKIPTASGGNGYFLAGKADSSSSLNGYTVFSYNGLVGVQIKNNSTTLGLSDATIRVGGLWHHVVLTYVSGGSSSLYVDGAVVESGTAPAFTMTNQPLRLGKSVDTYWQALAGSLDDVRVYNRVLSATEVRQLYQLGG